MLERERLESKKISKTNAVTSQLDHDLGAKNVHIGPSDHVAWLEDRKWAYIRLEGRSFGDVPLNIELKLEVVDSPHSAGIVIDAVRLLHEVAPGAAPRRRVPHPGRDLHREVHAQEVGHQGEGRGQGVRPSVADALNICLVSPYALAGGHPVAEYVRNEATGLAGRGHRVTVLAPSASSQSLRSGRRRLRSLAAGDGEALHALPGEPLAVAVGPAVPSGARGRGRGAGLPIAASANARAGRGEGGFDIVHAHEPIVPGLATAALRHTRGLIVATFHAETERALSYPIRSGRRKRYGSRIDALLAASTRAAELARTLYPGDYEVMPDPISGIFTPPARPAPGSWPSGRARAAASPAA
jgi:hypothetical protein